MSVSSFVGMLTYIVSSILNAPVFARNDSTCQLGFILSPFGFMLLLVRVGTPKAFFKQCYGIECVFRGI